ncbi:MAG TPA: tRNA (adenosine(37)-N6)-dimethylallyltransferase MiaA [Baekduia sp.]|uniref:tRNA (adenosine(37)-N6)-dimethylallyltransferase MiaA n=1 Tax=Baekduia sp. TaxID=2600305 RepID=UPI002D78749A|nr:tRNA (adenosine(37)-N6)-dimethylallyltransferase MiaA [Baekduia sp.]HET6509270.1 tRNA (adenosine(37)-N6)-dimethylallyltransferase MiaA [Baekduia sp.]
MPEILALFGPTGVGKTAVALAVADRLRARGERPVAVSADALQVYRGLEVLTGAADVAEQARLEHRMISILPVTARFSVAEYAERAHREIDAILHDGGTPIVVGGTGLYLRAALADLDLKPPPAPGVRERLMEELEMQGAAVMHARLADRAPEIAKAIDPGDRHRIVRALELDAQGALDEAPPRASRLWTSDTRHPTRLLALTLDRERLKRQIDARVDAMVAAGAREEVLAARAAGASETARKALGFAELLQGDVEAMKTRTRQYARRQLTWLRKLPSPPVEPIDATGREPDEIAAAILGG